MSGRPTVVTDAGGMAEAAGDGGLVVPPGDPAAFAAACVALLTHPERRKELAADRAAVRARALHAGPVPRRRPGPLRGVHGTRRCPLDRRPRTGDSPTGPGRTCRASPAAGHDPPTRRTPRAGVRGARARHRLGRRTARGGGGARERRGQRPCRTRHILRPRRARAGRGGDGARRSRPAGVRADPGPGRAGRPRRPPRDVLVPPAWRPLRRARPRHADAAAGGGPGPVRARARRPRAELGLVLRRRQHRLGPPRQSGSRGGPPLPPARAGRRCAARRRRRDPRRVRGPDGDLHDAGHAGDGAAPRRSGHLPPGGGDPAHDRPRTAAARRAGPCAGGAGARADRTSAGPRPRMDRRHRRPGGRSRPRRDTRGGPAPATVGCSRLGRGVPAALLRPPRSPGGALPGRERAREPELRRAPALGHPRRAPSRAVHGGRRDPAPAVPRPHRRTARDDVVVGRVRPVRPARRAPSPPGVHAPARDDVGRPRPRGHRGHGPGRRALRPPGRSGMSYWASRSSPRCCSASWAGRGGC